MPDHGGKKEVGGQGRERKGGRKNVGKKGEQGGGSGQGKEEKEEEKRDACTTEGKKENKAAREKRHTSLLSPFFSSFPCHGKKKWWDQTNEP